MVPLGIWRLPHEVLPGFIDTHVHLSWRFGEDGPANAGGRRVLALLVLDLEATEGVIIEGHSPSVTEVVFKHRQQRPGVRNVI